MERTKQLTVSLPNKPGALAKVCRALADGDVNIMAISVVDATETCLVRMIVDDARSGVKVLEDLKLEVVETPVRLIELPNKVGALAEMMERLAQRKVNVDFVYGSVAPGANDSVLVMEARSAK
ncbi:MAG: ACT domain-containing protein [Candidatus Brocadiia bacterium]|jgi:hypothetical protein